MGETYHLIGIGGAGMSALARVLHSRGIRVTGSDGMNSPTLVALEMELGVALHIGHSAQNLGSPDLVVASAAIKESNPEIVEAVRRGIKVVSRAELLGKVMDLYGVRVAVSGTHGKTTTSAMASQMLAAAGLDPTALIGADVPAWHSNTRLGKSGLVVAEACEAYGSFLELRPTHAIITNIEADHLDYYKDFDTILAAFRQFVDQTSDKVIVCADGGADRLLADRAGAKLLTYGLNSGDVSAKIDGPDQFTVLYRNSRIGKIKLVIPGRHNVLNALSVVALGMTLDVSFEKIAAGLAEFRGTSRRFEILGELPGAITIIDDYAHHPTEIRATLAATKSKYPRRRIVALFQPHLPSRTRDLMAEFADSFGDADELLITDIYLSREEAMPGITAQKLASEAMAYKGSLHVHYAGDLNEATEALRGTLKEGDVLLTIGAGSVRKAGEDLLSRPTPTLSHQASYFYCNNAINSLKSEIES